LNLYVVQAVRNEGSISDLFKGATPFLVAMLVMIAVLIIVPDLALWLPSVLNPKAGG